MAAELFADALGAPRSPLGTQVMGVKGPKPPAGISGAYTQQQANIMASEYLTEEQKQKWISEMDKALVPRSASTPGAFGVLGGNGSVTGASNYLADDYGKRLTDMKKEIEARKVYTQEHFNALNNSVNSKLQQTKITSFLGATAARAAL